MSDIIIASIVLLIIVLIVVILILLWRSKISIKYELEAQLYLDKYKGYLQKCIDNIIYTTNMSTIASFSIDGYTDYVLDKVFEEAWSYISTSWAFSDYQRKKLSKKAYLSITEDMVKEEIKEAFDDMPGFKELMERKLAKTFEDTIKESTEEDNAKQEEADLYELENIEVEPVDEIDINAVPDDIVLNPPREDGDEEYNPEDDSQELLESYEMPDSIYEEDNE